MVLQNLRSCFQIGRLIGGNQIFFCHYLVDTFIHVTLETKVTIRYNTDQISIVIHYRNAADLVFGHQGESITYGRPLLNSDRIVNHTVLGTLHCSHLLSLFLNGHILMDHANSPFARNGNSHLGFGNRVHGGSYKRNL